MFLSPEYIVIVVAILVYLFFFSKEKWPFYVIMAYMIFLGVFRGLEVGTDHIGYEEDFNLLKSFDSMKFIGHRFEIGYISLILFFKNFSNDYLLFSGLTFLVPMIGTCMFIKRYNINYAWALFVFFFMGMYFESMNLMRQFMAISSIAAFTYLLKKHEYIKFAIVVISFSIAFHLSSMVMLLLIPIFYCFEQKGYNISKKWLYIIIISANLLFYVGPKILSPIILGIMNIFPFDDFKAYITRYSAVEMSNTMVTINSIYALLVVYLNKSNKCNAELVCFVVFIVAYNILNMFTTYSFRAALPFKYYMIATIPLLIYNNRKQTARKIMLVTIVFMLAVFFVSYVMYNLNGVNPYSSWL